MIIGVVTRVGAVIVARSENWLSTYVAVWPPEVTTVVTQATTIDDEEESGIEVVGCEVIGTVGRSFVKPLLRVPAPGEPLTEPSNGLGEPEVLGNPVSE
jgi:hypothetical protein